MEERQQDSTTRSASQDKHFMDEAKKAAKDNPNTEVGACIVNKEDEIVGTGCHNMPKGCEGLPWNQSRDVIKAKHAYVCHAALNAIMNKTSTDVKGCTIYVSLFPCNECAKLIVQAGIKEVVFESDCKDEDFEASRILLDNAGITHRQVEHNEAEIVPPPQSR